MAIKPDGLPVLTLRSIRCIPVEVPLNFVMGTSQQAIRQVPLLLIDVMTEEGATGCSYLFCYMRAAQPGIMSLIGEIESLTKGKRLVPAALNAMLMHRFTLIGVQGIVRMAFSGFDSACWDALARVAELPLATMLGGEVRPIPAYNSCGLGIKEMRHYTQLYLEGESSIPERQEILAEKREHLETQLEELRKAIAYIDEKQRFYADVTAGRTAYCSNVIDTTQSD